MHKDWLRKSDSSVTFHAFMPHKRALSVFRIWGLSEQEVWEIGRDIADPQGKTLYGRGEVTAQTVTSAGLSIDPDNVPEDHANIVGWPDDKPKQKLRAMQLAKVAALTLYPGT